MIYLNLKIPSILAIAVVFLFALVVGVGVWALSQQEVSVSGGVTIPTKPPREESGDETVGLSPITSATEGWKTYRNEKYGFEFRHPEGWEQSESDNGYFLLTIGNPVSGLATYSFQVLAAFTENEDVLNLSPRFQKESERSVGSVICEVQPEMFDFDQIIYFVLCRKGNYTYVIQFPNGEKNKDNPNINDSVINGPVADQILSTFRFD